MNSGMGPDPPLKGPIDDACSFRAASAVREEELWAAEHKNLRARVLLTAGEKEINDPLTIVSATVRFAETLNSRNYRGLELRTWIIPDASHNQTAIPSMVRGLSRSGLPRG